ncbi:hypothetical protein SRHO_G00147240 [Serrasalmus rhombeus]
MLKGKWKMSLTVLIMASLTMVLNGKEAGRLVKGQKTSEEGGQILRGSPPQKLNTPHSTADRSHDPPVLGHVEDISSTAFWNTPFRVKVNLNAHALDATLDTGASLSTVRADLVQQSKEKTHPWGAPPIQLADGTSCSAVGIAWLTIGFMGKPDGPPVFDDAEMDDYTVNDFQGKDLSGLEVSPLTLSDKVDCVEAENKVQLLTLLEDFNHLFDGHLGHTSLTA